MKIIFSRKGFDSSAGGFASPIFEDGTLFSIPIPSSEDNHYYSELDFQYSGGNIQLILNNITNQKIISNKQSKGCDFSLNQQHCHYDPMIFEKANCMVLGQCGNAASHLRKNNVGKGDIFLFYGWFREVRMRNGQWIYTPSAKDIQLIWSWMRVGEVLDVSNIDLQQQAIEKYSLLNKHPHLSGDWGISPNSIYLSDAYGQLSYADARCLTDHKNYQGRSTWRLPACFNQKEAFTFLKNFTLDGEDVIITYRGYGQEFVLDLDKVSAETDRHKIIDYISHRVICSSPDLL